MHAAARPSVVVVRAFFGAAVGITAMWMTAVPVVHLLHAVVETSCRGDNGSGIRLLVCEAVLPGWAIALALVLSVSVGLGAAVGTGKLTRRMGAGLRQPTTG